MAVTGSSSESTSDHHHHPQQQPQQQSSSSIISTTTITNSTTLLNILLLDPFILLVSNPTLFLLIYILLTLPLSLLLTSLSLASAPIQSQIQRLESLSRLIQTRIEAMNILEEAHGESKALLRLRAVHALPCLLLSLLTLVAVVVCATTTTTNNNSNGSSSGTKRTRRVGVVVVEKVKDAWWRVVLTGVVTHAAAAGVGEGVRTAVGFGIGRGGEMVGFGVGVVGWVMQVYMAAVMGVGMVVAVAEEKWGVDAVWVGWGIMKGSRICGWVAAGVVTAVMGCVRWEMEGTTLLIVAAEYYAWRCGLVCLLGLVLIWGNVVLAVYYSDCRKRNSTTATYGDDDDDDHYTDHV